MPTVTISVPDMMYMYLISYKDERNVSMSRAIQDHVKLARARMMELSKEQQHKQQ